MRPDFGVLILSHGRPDNVKTWQTLDKAGYTGKRWIVIDDEDKRGQEYIDRYGDAVIVFCKKDAAAITDSLDNIDRRDSVLYARNAAWGIAKSLGLRYFLELDDDYVKFEFRFRRNWAYKVIKLNTTADGLFDACVQMLIKTKARAFCLAQGGDFIGGFPPGKSLQVARRKAMNAFFFDVQNPVYFIGRANDDVNTYTSGGRRGELFLTTMMASIVQAQTQAQSGGLTDMYLHFGTYHKSFMSVLVCPSAVRVGVMQDPRSPHPRVHHVIDWPRCAAMIIPDRFRKSKKVA
jgi:hypothetical protein